VRSFPNTRVVKEFLPDCFIYGLDPDWAIRTPEPLSFGKEMEVTTACYLKFGKFVQSFR